MKIKFKDEVLEGTPRRLPGVVVRNMRQRVYEIESPGLTSHKEVSSLLTENFRTKKGDNLVTDGDSFWVGTSSGVKDVTLEVYVLEV